MIHMTTMRTSVLAFILILGFTFSFVWAENRFIAFEEGIVVETPSKIGFEEVRNGVFRATKPKDEFHSLNTPITLFHDAYYRIRYDILNLPEGKVILTADLYAPSYDNPKQELSKIVGMNDLGKQQDFIINTGKSPDHAHFRLFYSGAPGLEVANIQITRVAAWRIWLKRGLLASAFVALIVFAFMAINRVWILSRQSRPNEVSASKILVTEIPSVVAIYLGAVLIRFSMYILMPYWSGDEYAYKSIAAGIWHFGHHGILTDGMVSFSVDYPNLLYPYLISPAFVLGENFYIGVRLINAIVINLAIFPTYLIARKFIDKTPALIAAGLSIAIPFINLGAYAVTEVLFFPLFMLAIWIAIESIEHRKSVGWVLGFGVVAGILLNVRLNAMILLPAYLFSLLWISFRHRQVLTFFSQPYWLVAVITFLFTYVALKYSLDGRAIGDFGFYGRVATQTGGPLSIIASNPAGFFNLLAGHMTTLAIPYALPIALIINSIASHRNKMYIDIKFNDFLVITSIFSSALFVLALIFTIGVSPIDLGGLGRWHSRYYFYFYPLIIIAGAVFADRLQTTLLHNRFGVILIVVLLLLTSVYFIKIHGALQNPWFGSIADNMDVQWYRSVGKFYWIFAAFTAALTWLWYKRSTYFSGGLLCFMIISVIVANLGTMRVTGTGEGAHSDTCGSISQKFLDHHPGRFIVVGDSRITMIAAAFWNPYIPERTFLYNDDSKFLSKAEIGIAADYLVVNGVISVDPVFRRLISLGQCAIYEMRN